jgi:serine/threonine protein kinase
MQLPKKSQTAPPLITFIFPVRSKKDTHSGKKMSADADKVHCIAKSVHAAVILRKIGTKRLVEKTLFGPNSTQEVIMHLRLSPHPHIVRLVSCSHKTPNTTPSLTMEYAPRGDLHKVVTTRQQPFSVRATRKYTAHMVASLAHVHSKGYAHCDVKLENFLMCKNGVVKLCDFGLSSFRKEMTSADYPRYTSYCASPEVTTFTLAHWANTQKKPYDAHAADVWALGVAVYALVRARPPFSTRIDKAEQKTPTNTPKTLAYLEEISTPVDYNLQFPDNPALASFLSVTLAVDPSSRLTMSELAAHPWVAGPKPAPSELV